MENEFTKTVRAEAALVEALAQASSDIRWAEAAGRSKLTINRLYRKYFKIEDALKAFAGGW